MRTAFSIMLAGLAGLLGTPFPGFAHHSPTNYDLGQVIEIEGEIMRVLWRNPLVRFWVMHEEESGEETLWEVQATPVVHLMREGITRELMSVGDTGRPAASGPRSRSRHLLSKVYLNCATYSLSRRL